jgi:hypothetical protein
VSTRTRTKRTNNQPPLKLSTLSPDEYNVRRGEPMTIVCRGCRQWRRVMGATTLKVIEHGTTACPDTRQITHGTCPGSRQLVVVDIDITRWTRRQNQLSRDGLHAHVRTTAAQFSKPTPLPAPAVSQIEAPLLNLAVARDAHLAHRARCAACQGRDYCTDGLRLADLYVRLLRQEPGRERRRELLAEVTAEQEQQTARQCPRTRAQEWQRVDAAVQRADKARELSPAGALPDTHTKVPLAPPRITV